MKITKSQLKQIIKEELEVTLTNEEAAEMFGEDVREQLEDHGTIAYTAARRIAGLDDPWEMEQEIKRAAEEYKGKQL